MENKHTQQVDFSNPNADKISSASTISFKQETLEEAAEKYAHNYFEMHSNHYKGLNEGFIKGAKWQAERMYSEEDMKSTIEKTVEQCNKMMQESYGLLEIDVDYIFEQFKKK
jgi:hypothetical protein